MYIHGVFAESSNLGDLRNVQVLHEPQEENGSLLLRQGLRGFPYRLDFFVHCGFLFWRNAPIRPFMDLVATDAWRFSPELPPATTGMVSNEINCDPHQPCIDAAVSAKGSPIPVRTPETVLSHCFGQIHVVN